MKLSKVCLLAATTVLVGCATFQIQPKVTDGVTIQYQRGVPTPTYSDSQAQMSVQMFLENSEIQFAVTVKNKTDQTWSVSDSDFVVEVSDDGNQWRPVRVYSSAESYARERSYWDSGVSVGFGASSLTPGRSSVGAGIVVGQGFGNYGAGPPRGPQVTGGSFPHGPGRLHMLENNLFYRQDLAANQEYFGLVFSAQVIAQFYRIVNNNPWFHHATVQFERVKTSG